MKASLIAAAAVLQDHVSVGEMLNVDNLCIPSGSTLSPGPRVWYKSKSHDFCIIFLVDGLLVEKIVNGGLKDLRAHSDTCYSKCPVAAL